MVTVNVTEGTRPAVASIRLMPPRDQGVKVVSAKPSESVRTLASENRPSAECNFESNLCNLQPVYFQYQRVEQQTVSESGLLYNTHLIIARVNFEYTRRCLRCRRE